MSRKLFIIASHAHVLGLEINSMSLLREEIRKLSDTHDIVLVDNENDNIEEVIKKLKEADMPPVPYKLQVQEYADIDHRLAVRQKPHNQPKNFFSNMSNRDRRKMVKRKY